MRVGALQFGHSRQFCPVNFLKCNVQELCTRVVLWDSRQHHVSLFPINMLISSVMLVINSSFLVSWQFGTG
jgi:hypothetical protein